MNLKELTKALEKGIYCWGEFTSNPFVDYWFPTSRGCDVAAEAVRIAVRKYGKEKKVGDGYMDYEFKFSKPITLGGLNPVVSVKVDHCDMITVYTDCGDSIGSRTPFAEYLRKIMEGMEESLTPKKTHTREEAIEIAREAGLEGEVLYEMDENGCTPNEALYEWDILEFE